MFYSDLLPNSSKTGRMGGPLSRVWLAAHWEKRLTKAHVFETNVSGAAAALLTQAKSPAEGKFAIALRTSGHLLVGIVRIYNRKAKYLLADCNEAFVKIKMAFRPDAVDLPAADDDSERQAALATLSLPDPTATLQDLDSLDALGGPSLDFSLLKDPLNNAALDTTLSAFTGFNNDNLLRGYGNDGTVERLTNLEKIKDELNQPINDDGFGGGLDDSPSSIFDSDDEVKDDDDIFSDGAHSKHPFSPKREQLDTTGGLFEEHSIMSDSSDGFEALSPEVAHQRRLDRKRNRQLAGGATPSLDEIDATIIDNESVDDIASTIFGEEQGFILDPIAPSDTMSVAGASDVTYVTAQERRTKARRKRRLLVVDEPKSIPSEAMKEQMKDTADIMGKLELAPPTKQLMEMKEQGVASKLLAAPQCTLATPCLTELFLPNLTSRRRADNGLTSYAGPALPSLLPKPKDEPRDAEDGEKSDEDQPLLAEAPSMNGDDFQLDPTGERPSSISADQNGYGSDGGGGDDADGRVSSSSSAPEEEEEESVTQQAAKRVKREPNAHKDDGKSHTSQLFETMLHKQADAATDEQPADDFKLTKRTHEFVKHVERQLYPDGKTPVDSFTFDKMVSAKESRKSVAAKFYTCLFLKKFQLLEINQPAASKVPARNAQTVSLSAGPRLKTFFTKMQKS